MDTMTLTAQDLIDGIKEGKFDSMLGAIQLATEERLAASRKTRTMADYNIGDKVVFNNLTATRYMVGQKATVVGRKQKKLVVRLDSAVGRFSRVSADGTSLPTDVTVPVAIVDLI